MADEKKLQQAQAAFGAFCQMMEKNDWNFKRDDEELRIECGARGDDLPIDINIHVDAERSFIMLFSRMPVTVPEDKRLDVAVAVACVNYQLVNGHFDYDINSGRMFFRMTNSFMDSPVSEELCTYMLYCSCQTIDEYNDKFLMIAKNMLSLEQFLQSENS